MSLTVKAYLQKDGKWDAEIRRFQVPADASSSFDYLSKKLCDIFPSLTSGNFSVFWRDPDGDHVSFSCDEELMEALGFVTDGIFKIYLILNAGNGAQQQDSNVVHPGVLCDGCEGPVCGPRFKCLVCPDYDLCKGCEGRGIHVEHDMMKINVPGTFPAFPGGFPFPGPMGAPGPHGPGPQGPFAPPPHFRRWMQKFMRRWHDRNAPGWKEGAEKCEKEGEKMEQDGEKEQPCGQSGEEFLKCVGETVSAMLDPLGIDVDVSVDSPKEDGTDSDGKDEADKKTDGEKQRRGRGQGCRGRGQGRCGRGQRGGGFGGPWDMYAFMSGCPMEQWQWQGHGQGQGKGKCGGGGGRGEGCKNKGKKNPAGPDVHMQNQTPPEKMPESQDKMDVEAQDPKAQQKDTWTLLNMNGEPTGASNIPEPQPQPLQPVPAPSAPLQQNQGPLYPPTDPKIAESLQQMMSMGFTNEGGWLTNLLEAKNGDIVQVLDAVRPQKSRTTQGGTMA